MNGWEALVCIVVGLPMTLTILFVGMSWAEAYNNVGQAKARAAKCTEGSLKGAGK